MAHYTPTCGVHDQGLDTLELLVGKHVPVTAGLRVNLSVQGQADLGPEGLGLSLTRGRPGVITKVHEDGDACMVRWQAYDGEAGWYRTGAYNVFSLVACDAANSVRDVADRKQRANAQGDFDDLLHKTKAGYL